MSDEAGGVQVNDPLGVRADERKTLTGTLDWYRAVIENKLAGLSTDDASRVMTKSGLSPSAS